MVLDLYYGNCVELSCSVARISEVCHSGPVLVNVSRYGPDRLPSRQGVTYVTTKCRPTPLNAAGVVVVDAGWFAEATRYPYDAYTYDLTTRLCHAYMRTGCVVSFDEYLRQLIENRDVSGLI